MINTKILMQEFEYVEPKTVEEALDYLSRHEKGAKVMAGGTDLLVRMKTEKVRPEVLVNIARIPALRYLIEEKGLRIGSLTTFRELERSRRIKEQYTALFEAAQSVSSVQIKTMGTLGGNLCHASPAADSAPPLIVFGGKVKIAGKKGERVLSLEEFFVGPGETALFPSELLIEIQVPEISGETGSSFLKMGRVSADLAKVSVAVVIEKDGELCKSCRIALGAVAERPLRALKAEEMMRGEKFTEGLVRKVSQEASEEIRPITDLRSTDWYRKEVSKALVRDAIHLAWNRASVGE